MQQPHLIFDIGAHEGDDTGYYLKQGYNVVAVEANPDLAKRLENIFEKEIIEEKLVVINAAIAENDRQTVSFFISKDNWRSSIIKDHAAREASITRTVELQTVTLSGLIKKYGAPFYCKIDIEGYDAIAINSLSNERERPSCISCEISCHSIEEINRNNDLLYETISALKTAGYSTFKLIDQYTLIQLRDQNFYGRLYKLPVRMFTKLEQLTGLYSPKYNNRLYLAKKRKTNPDYLTTSLEEIETGNWDDFETTKKQIKYHFDDYFSHTKNKQLIFWVDLFAKW